jgi:hypothetical protein
MAVSTTQPRQTRENITKTSSWSMDLAMNSGSREDNIDGQIDGVASAGIF